MQEVIRGMWEKHSGPGIWFIFEWLDKGFVYMLWLMTLGRGVLEDYSGGCLEGNQSERVEIWYRSLIKRLLLVSDDAESNVEKSSVAVKVKESGDLKVEKIESWQDLETSWMSQRVCVCVCGV